MESQIATVPESTLVLQAQAAQEPKPKDKLSETETETKNPKMVVHPVKTKPANSSNNTKYRQQQSNIRGIEHISRVNYLFQASEKLCSDKSLPQLSQFYGKVLNTVAEKTSAKLDYTMKRSLCKKCETVLVPGINVTYRLKRRKKKNGKNSNGKCLGFPTQIFNCKYCGTSKKFSTNPKHCLKAELKGSLIELAKRN